MQSGRCFLLLMLPLLLAACVALPSPAAETAPGEISTASQISALPSMPPASCPVTQPPEPPFIPPEPHPAVPNEGHFWYGTNALWTALPAGGIWADLPHDSGSYGQKLFWWREGYSAADEPTPDLAVTGRRLDAETDGSQAAPQLNASPATNAFAEDIQSAMLVGVEFPTAGCWEITGRHAGRELTFIVWVAP